MSRIGKLPISIPAGVTVAQDKDGVVTVKGPKGELSQKVDGSIKMKVEDGHITFEIDENSPVNVKQKQAFHGLYRALVNNMVVGVSEGYKKEMELVGVGYRVSNQGNLIEFSLGYTHPIFLQLPQEVKVETKSERNQNPQIILESCDKQLLGLLGHQLAHLLGLFDLRHGLQTERRGSGKRLAFLVINHLSIDLLVRAEHTQTRTLGSAEHVLANSIFDLNSSFYFLRCHNL